MLSTITLTALLAVTNQQAIDLKLNVAKDTQLTYALHVEATTEQGDQLKIDSDLVQKFLEINEDGTHVMTSVQKSVKLSHMGQEFPFADPPANSMTFSPTGAITNIAGDDVDATDYRFQNLITVTWPGKPLSVNDTWTAKFAADEETGAVEAEATYSLAVVEDLLGRKCAKIRFEVKELTGTKPSTASGVTWIDIATGTRVKAMADMTNVQVGNSISKVKWEMTLKPSA